MPRIPAALVGAVLLLVTGASPAQEGAEAPPTPPLPVPEGFELLTPWVWVNWKDSQILTFGAVAQPSGLLELFACPPRGKTHESVVEVACRASDFNAACMLLRFDPPRMKKPPEGETPTEASFDTLRIFVEWEEKQPDESTKIVRHRAEDTILMASTRKTMPHVNWLYIGSGLREYPRDWAHPDAGSDLRYEADMAGVLVTVFADSWTVVENPLPEAVSDEVWLANEALLPERGTPVRLIFEKAETITRKLVAVSEEGHGPGGGGPGAPPGGEEEPDPGGEDPDDPPR